MGLFIHQQARLARLVGSRAAPQKPAENMLSPRPLAKILSRSTRCPGRTSKTGGKYTVAPAACQISLAKYPVSGPHLKIRRKIYRRLGRLPKFTREVPGARAAPQNSAENIPSPRPPGWFKVRHFSLILPELIEELQDVLFFLGRIEDKAPADHAFSGRNK
ncbi:MAG: hypothetical protein QNK37_07685 [Acidobacteriota bacterium]|nr:hypothetical protein [Acidobacteriota bacterium]